MEIIGARLGDDVDDSAERPARFSAEAVVHHAEFLHGFLRRRGALHAAGRIDEIRAVHGDFVAEGAHAAEGDLRRLILGKRGSQAGAAGGDAGSEEREIGEEAPVDGQGLDLPASRRPG